MPAKPLAVNKTRRRKHNKSSPANQRYYKKHKTITITDSDSEDSVYFEIENIDSDSDSQNSPKKTPHPHFRQQTKWRPAFQEMI